jgi:hypothetical protein
MAALVVGESADHACFDRAAPATLGHRGGVAGAEAGSPGTVAGLGDSEITNGLLRKRDEPARPTLHRRLSGALLVALDVFGLGGADPQVRQQLRAGELATLDHADRL